MNPDLLREYANRDWSLVEDATAEYWAATMAAMSPEEAIALGDRLRVHALTLRPDWPDSQEREDDIETHTRVSRMLNRASRLSDR